MKLKFKQKYISNFNKQNNPFLRSVGVSLFNLIVKLNTSTNKFKQPERDYKTLINQLVTFKRNYYIFTQDGYFGGL